VLTAAQAITATKNMPSLSTKSKASTKVTKGTKVDRNDDAISDMSDGTLSLLNKKLSMEQARNMGMPMVNAKQNNARVQEVIVVRNTDPLNDDKFKLCVGHENTHVNGGCSFTDYYHPVFTNVANREVQIREDDVLGPIAEAVDLIRDYSEGYKSIPSWVNLMCAILISPERKTADFLVKELSVKGKGANATITIKSSNSKKGAAGGFNYNALNKILKDIIPDDDDNSAVKGCDADTEVVNMTAKMHKWLRISKKIGREQLIALSQTPYPAENKAASKKKKANNTVVVDDDDVTSVSSGDSEKINASENKIKRLEAEIALLKMKSSS
jgi:hypothetical protein